MFLVCADWPKAAIAALGVLALIGAAPATACTMPAGMSAEQFQRNHDAQIRHAPVVVEGYVEVGKMVAGKPPRRPIARLIPRKFYKGPRQAYFPLDYVPTTCHVPFPTNKAKRQKVYLSGAKGYFVIIHIEPLN